MLDISHRALLSTYPAFNNGNNNHPNCLTEPSGMALWKQGHYHPVKSYFVSNQWPPHTTSAPHSQQHCIRFLPISPEGKRHVWFLAATFLPHSATFELGPFAPGHQAELVAIDHPITGLISGEC